MFSAKTRLFSSLKDSHELSSSALEPNFVSDSVLFTPFTLVSEIFWFGKKNNQIKNKKNEYIFTTCLDVTCHRRIALHVRKNCEASVQTHYLLINKFTVSDKIIKSFNQKGKTIIAPWKRRSQNTFYVTIYQCIKLCISRKEIRSKERSVIWV